MKLSGILSQLAATAILCSAPWAMLAQSPAVIKPTAGPSKPRALAIPKYDASVRGSNTQTFTLSLPGAVRGDSLKVMLNGKDVTSRFQQTSCQGGYCAEGTVSAEDGLILGNKNVLEATARTEEGRVVSTRQRFLGGNTPSAGLTKVARPMVSTQAAANSYDTITDWLPPSVVMMTPTAGGYNWGSNKPWIQVGSVTYPALGYYCVSQYLTVVLDRQTLAEKTDVSPHCSSTTADLNAFLAQRDSTDLVITGSVWQSNADGTLDTSTIGGTNYSTLPSDSQAQGYMAIGTGGAQPGQAYESYWAPKTGAVDPFALGMLNEDMNGNYNFRSSETVEYIASPNDPNHGGQSSLTVALTSAQQVDAGFTKNVFLSPVSGNSPGGYYVQVLDRRTLDSAVPVGTAPDPSNLSVTCTVDKSTAPNYVYSNCGLFFPTGSSNSATATAAYNKLAATLQTVTPYQMALLITVGNAAFAQTDIQNGGVWQVAATENGGTGAFTPLVPTLKSLGVNPQDLLHLYESTSQGTYSTYTAIIGPGLGDSLSGSTVISSTYYSQQGQTGYVHGVFQRDRLGWYKPGQTSQQVQGHDNADFSIPIVASLSPVEWPSASATVLLPGADSTAGQLAAFNYLSWELLNNYYIKGLSSPYQWDIHYFFTGSLNTFIDYHHFDPINAVWPGTTGFGGDGHVACESVVNQVCTWKRDPSLSSSMTLQFTQNDFNAVKVQVSKEVVALTNVLQFMVSGSVNMKDIVAGGSANTGLAVVGAASTVESSLAATLATQTKNSQPAPAKVDVVNILSQIGSAVGFVAGIGTGTLPLEEATVTAADKALTIVGGMFGEAAGIGGALSNKATQTQLPSTNYAFFSTLSEIANSDLQGDLSAGFDTSLDSILGDWGKLSTIGGYVTDTNNQAFYAPNQVAQNLAIQAFGKGAQRSLYLQMVPQFYYLDLWPSVHATDPYTGDFPADMGYTYSESDHDYCAAFYPYDSAPEWSGFAWPTYYGQPWPFPWNPHYTSDSTINWGLLAGDATGKGTSDPGAKIPLMDPVLLSALFDADQMNLPQSPFFFENGPMSVLRPNGTSAVHLMSDSNTLLAATGWKTGDICAVSQGPAGPSGVVGASPQATTTTLTAPVTALAGDQVVLQASVSSGSTPVTAGTVIFYDNGVSLGSQNLGPTNTVTLTLNSMNAGTHNVWASFPNQGDFRTSSSAHAELSVYTTRPEIALSLSAGTLQVTYGNTSSAVTLQAGSLSGLNGTITFSCSGLPIGMSCSFNPATTSIGDGQTVSTQLTVTATPLQTSSISKLSGVGTMAMILPLALLGLRRNRKGMRIYQVIGCFVILGMGMAVVGCGNSTPKSKPVQETGTKTILVNATCGSVTRTVPLVLNIQ